VHFSGENKGLPKDSTNARYGFGCSNSGTALIASVLITLVETGKAISFQNTG
jgi:hypothetical protein